MFSPKVRFLFLFLMLSPMLLLSSPGSAGRPEPASAPQRLRVRVEQQRLTKGQGTRVIVEFVDLNYAQVTNDATREITFGRVSPGEKQSGWGDLRPETIVVKPGAGYGETTFTSSQLGRLFITASSQGLESSQTLISIVAQSASFLSRLSGVFETVAYADPLPSLEILPKKTSAVGNGEHRAEFQLALGNVAPAGTVVRITTTLSSGKIFYRGNEVGTTIASIPIDEGKDQSDPIAIQSAVPETVEISASVRNGPSDNAQVIFNPPKPTQVKFEQDPASFESDAGTVPVKVYLADGGGSKIAPDKERRVSFRACKDEQINFQPETVVLSPDQPSAQVMFRLKELPLGNDIKIQAESEGLDAGFKPMMIKSAIAKLMISGQPDVRRGGREAEYTIYFADKDNNPKPADWDREIDLRVDDGTLANTQLIVKKGTRKAVVKYSSPNQMGKYTLTASSDGMEPGSHTITVLNAPYLLVLLALLGGLVGGIAHQLHYEKKILSRRLAGGLVGGLFLYLAIKLGVWEALGSPNVPGALDPGTLYAAFFVGGPGGYVGPAVLGKLAGWFMPSRAPHLKADAAPVVQPRSDESPSGCL